MPSNAWNKIGVSSVVTDGGLTAKLEVWWRRATASEPANYGFDVWGSNQNEYYAASYSGCPTSGSPVDAFSQNGANTGSTATGLSVTTTQANDKLIYLGHNWSASGTLNPPVGMTERHDFISYSADETIALAGATGNRTQAQAASSPWAAFLDRAEGEVTCTIFRLPRPKARQFHPPGGPIYVFSSPKWLIQGGTSGGGGGTGEAAWDEITGKPSTYPPTLPIAQSGVTNLTTDLAAKAPLASPGLTGTPTAPTAAPGTNTTQVASTAFVKGAVDANVEDWSTITGKPATFPPALPIAQAGVTNLLTDLAAKAPINDPVLTGNARAPTAATGDNTTQIATTAHVKANLVGLAPLASPSFTGDPKVPTPSLSDNDTSIANTQFVQGVVTTVLATKAPLDSPVFTGNPTAPTPNPGDSDASIATTEFVSSMILPWTQVSGKPSTFPPTVPIAWTDVSGKPATYPPTLPIAQADVTNLTTDLGLKAPLASPAFTGAPTAPWPTLGTSIVNVDFLNDTVSGIGGGGAATLIADVAPTVPAPVHGQLWWDSSTANLYIWYDDGTSAQWVQVNATGAA